MTPSNTLVEMRLACVTPIEHFSGFGYNLTLGDHGVFHRVVELLPALTSELVHEPDRGVLDAVLPAVRHQRVAREAEFHPAAVLLLHIAKRRFREVRRTGVVRRVAAALEGFVAAVPEVDAEGSHGKAGVFLSLFARCRCRCVEVPSADVAHEFQLQVRWGPAAGWPVESPATLDLGSMGTFG
ncbi:hypothetical protein PG984_015237 [Apiospora sp. TS-2023a]